MLTARKSLKEPMRGRRAYFTSYMAKFHPEINLEMNSDECRTYVDPVAQVHWEGFKSVLVEFRQHMSDYANWGGQCVVAKATDGGGYEFTYKPQVHKNMISALCERDRLNMENPGVKHQVFTVFNPELK